MDVVVIGRGVRSRPQSPFSNDLDSVCCQQDPSLVGASPLDHLDCGFGVLLGRGGLPCTSLEPRGVGREPLGAKEVGSQFAVFGASEFEMVGELMYQLAAQRRRGSRDPHRQDCGVRPVLGPGIQFPCGFEGDRRKAIMAGGYRSKEVIPGLIGEGPQIIRDTLGVEQFGRRGGACRGSDGDGEQEGCEVSIHETRILFCPCSGGEYDQVG